MTNAALIGVGNLGNALLNFNFHQNSNVRISAAFDVKADLANTVKSGVPVYPMAELEKQLKDQQIQVAIITVPADVAQSVTDEAIAGGIRGILNFTPLRVSVPNNVRVQNVDLTNELQTLIYFLDHYNEEA